VRRGEIWTVSATGYAGKPRPAVIVQGDSFDLINTLTICPFTTNPTDAPILRLMVQPSVGNGLKAPSRLMVDKMWTVPKSRISAPLGRLDAADLHRLDQAMLVFLGLVGATA
jgi:mRNA interferase MazF